jgi:glycosyltransferase involved in cell wall biosynthesis
VTGADFQGLRVLIVHEWLYTWAGGERCVEQMFEMFPNADLLVGVVMPEMRNYNAITRHARESWVGRLPGARTKHRWFLPMHGVAFALEDTSTYDLVISSSHAVEKFVRTNGRTKHVCYCYTPPRFLWDMHKEYLSFAGRLERMALRLSTPVLRWADKHAARGVDRFVSISKYVAARVERTYGVPSVVVYPPVTAKPGLASAGQRAGGEPYLLYLGRLVEYKRVDLLVQAAERLQRRLIVAGDGPERARLERIAGRHTEFLGEVSEERAGDLLSNCSAFVFAGEEDFGISLVEANAHGRPVVCLGRGGATETMASGKTAVLFDRQDVDALCAAITECEGRAWDGDLLRANARRFSPEAFRDGFRREVESVRGG